MQQPSELRKIAFIGDYLPRKCGIATFTHDVCKAVSGVYSDLQCFVIPDTPFVDPNFYKDQFAVDGKHVILTFGLLQHAQFSVPHYAEGYCTDDNARALILAVLLEELGDESSTLQALAYRYLAFLNNAFDQEGKQFRNFMAFTRTWSEKVGSEDSQGRALWALGVCVGRSKNTCFHTLAGRLFEESLPSSPKFTNPRSYAFALIGIYEYLERLPGDRLANQIRDTLTTRLLEHFKANRETDWIWFEQARNIFEWYLGRNDLGLELYNSTTGGCCDALHVDRVNRNEGAESTLAFLLSVAELQQMQNVISAFSKP